MQGKVGASVGAPVGFDFGLDLSDLPPDFPDLPPFQPAHDSEGAFDTVGAADHHSLLVDLLDLEDLAVLLLVGLPPLPDLPPPQVDAGTHSPPSNIISVEPIEKDMDWADAVVARDAAARMDVA